MTKEELLALLNELKENDGDTETNHSRADAGLLMFINDPEITTAYQAIKKWYA